MTQAPTQPTRPTPANPLLPDIRGFQPQQITPGGGTRSYFYSGPIRTSEPDIYYWWLRINDWRGGLNRTYGDFERDFDRAMDSTLETRFFRTGCLNQLRSTASSPDPTGTLAGIHSVRGVFSRTFFATGSGNDVSFFKTTSATDPTPVAITGAGTAGRPGSSVTSLTKIISNGASTAVAILMGRAGAAPLKVTDANGTIGATGHSGLNPTWAHWNTPFGNVFYTGNSIKTQPVTSEISAAPTETITGLVAGGFSCGPEPLGRGGGQPRLYFCEPLTNNTAGALVFGSEVKYRVKSIDLQGQDLQPTSFGEHFVDGVTWAGNVGDGVLAHNEDYFVWNRGYSIEPIYVFSDRKGNSDREFKIRDVKAVENGFYYRVNYKATASGTGNTQEWWEFYDFATKASHIVNSLDSSGNVLTHGSTGLYGVLGAGTAVYDDLSKNIIWYSDGAWYWFSYPRPGLNTFMLRKTSGSAAGSGVTYGPQGLYESPYMVLGGMDGWAKTIARVTCEGLLEDSGTPTTPGQVIIYLPIDTRDTSIPRLSYSFEANGWPNRRKVWSDIKPNRFDLFQYNVEIIQQTGGTDPTRTTPQALPLTFEGFGRKPKFLIAPRKAELGWEEDLLA